MHPPGETLRIDPGGIPGPNFSPRSPILQLEENVCRTPNAPPTSPSIGRSVRGRDCSYIDHRQTENGDQTDRDDPRHPQKEKDTRTPPNQDKNPQPTSSPKFYRRPKFHRPPGSLTPQAHRADLAPELPKHARVKTTALSKDLLRQSSSDRIGAGSF